jgi:hypothetical protein
MGFLIDLATAVVVLFVCFYGILLGWFLAHQEMLKEPDLLGRLKIKEDFVRKVSTRLLLINFAVLALAGLLIFLG